MMSATFWGKSGLDQDGLQTKLVSKYVGKAVLV